MIDTIIFDFGNIFIDVDRSATDKALKRLGLKSWNDDLEQLNHLYELGKIDEMEFILGIQQHIPNSDLVSIRQAWNAQIGDFPLAKLEFLQMLASQFRLFLLSNADPTHIERFEHKFGMTFAKDFYNCFEKVYFSFEYGFRKPELKAFQFIVNNHNLNVKDTLFIDDTIENIKSAEQLGCKTWHLNPETENVKFLHDKLSILHE